MRTDHSTDSFQSRYFLVEIVLPHSPFFSLLLFLKWISSLSHLFGILCCHVHVLCVRIHEKCGPHRSNSNLESSQILKILIPVTELCWHHILTNRWLKQASQAIYYRERHPTNKNKARIHHRAPLNVRWGIIILHPNLPRCHFTGDLHHNTFDSFKTSACEREDKFQRSEKQAKASEKQYLALKAMHTVSHSVLLLR